MFWASPVTYQDHRRWPRGTTEGGQRPREIRWAKWAWEPAPRWAGAPPSQPIAQGREKGGQTLGQVGLRPTRWCATPSSPFWPPHLPSGGAAAPPRVGTLGVAPPLPLPYIYRALLAIERHGFSLSLGAALLFFLLLSAGAWRSLAGRPRLSTNTTLSCCWSSSPTSPSSLLDQGAGDVTGLHVC